MQPVASGAIGNINPKPVEEAMPSQSLAPYRSRSLEPFRPASPAESFFRQSNRWFEDVFREFDETRESMSGILAPSIDVTQNDSQTCITAELPGVKEEDVDVSVDNDVLTIRAEKRIEREDDKDVRHVRERAYGTFQRSLRLPQSVNLDQVKAHFDRGVLTVTLPRTAPDEGRHKIAIASGPPPQGESPAKPESRH